MNHTTTTTRSSTERPASAASDASRTGWHAVRTRARQVAAAIVLGYLAIGVALPWLLLDAPAVTFSIAAAPAPFGPPPVAHP
jgi:hypothetical protein